MMYFVRTMIFSFGTECQRFTGIVVGRILHHRTSGLEILFTLTTFLFDWYIFFLLFWEFFKVCIAINENSIQGTFTTAFLNQGERGLE